MRYCYLAGPITGHTFDEATDWREDFAKQLHQASAWWSDGWKGLSPMRAKDQFRMTGPLPSTFDEGKAAVMRDLNDIRRSDAVLVNLAGAERVSIGTMAELGYAYAKEKFILVVLPPAAYCDWCVEHEWDTAMQECPDKVTNPHDHIFVHEMASQIVPSLEDALDVLLAL